jgi:hypothetical protein
MVSAFSAVAGLVILCVSAGESTEGEIALSAPQCAYFVVRTSSGFSLLAEQEYFSALEGDYVRGLRPTTGVQQVEIVGELTLKVIVEHWGVDRLEATDLFHRRCNARSAVGHEQD